MNSWMLSNGATNQMMTPQMQEDELGKRRGVAFSMLAAWWQDGIVVLVPMTEEALQQMTRGTFSKGT